MNESSILSTVRSAVIACLLLAQPVGAHVLVLAPDGGEVFDVGDSVTITWRVEIAHPALNWDVFYSTTGPVGPWIPIAIDLPPGATSVGSVHRYDWTVPDTPTIQARVRVVMDNPGTDYEDVSNFDFEITAPITVGRLQLLRLTAPLPDGSSVFATIPCTLLSDLRLCEEAPGTHESFDDPLFPFSLADDGELVFINYDSDIGMPGPMEWIMVTKDLVDGSLLVELP